MPFTKEKWTKLGGRIKGHMEGRMFPLTRMLLVLAIKKIKKSIDSMKTRILFRVIICIALIHMVTPAYYNIQLYRKYNYPHLPAEAMETHLYKQITPELVLQKSKPECEYGEILKSTSKQKYFLSKLLKAAFKENYYLNKIFESSLPVEWEVPDDFSEKGLVNGSYVPEHCNPKFSVALIVPYRNRQTQLDIFLPYMHNFLRKQNIHYRIYLVEQQDENTYNKGILLNVGAKTAIRDKFPCLILHDVDLLPLDESNLYACTNEPRHMSASIDKFLFVLPYDYIVGGVLAIKSEQFVAVNGLSNRFYAWGGEDDDFWYRLNAHKFHVVRFSPKISQYTMLKHGQRTSNGARRIIMRETRQHEAGASDGLSTLPYVTTRVKNHRLFTLVGVQL